MFGAKTIVMLSVVAALTLGGGVYAVAENLRQPLPPQKARRNSSLAPYRRSRSRRRPRIPLTSRHYRRAWPRILPKASSRTAKPRCRRVTRSRISGKPDKVTATGCRYGPARYATITSKGCWS
jgi:hypothetical protein